VSVPDPAKVLVISLAGAGDTLMATPLLRELRAAWPQARIDVLVMQGVTARDILGGNPAVDRILYHNFMAEPFLRSVAYCLRLRRERYDLSFSVMPQNRLEYNGVAWLAGARRRIGFDFAVKCGALERWLQTDLVREDIAAHLVDNNLRLFTEGAGRPLAAAPHRLELAIPPAADRAAADWLAARVPEGGLCVGFHPGSGTTKNLALRRWDPSHWAALARRMAERHGAHILLFGAAEEQELRDRIIREAGQPDGRVLSVEPQPILQAAALIRRMRLFVCCDTLLTHIAAAAGVPTVVIMGPTPHTSVYPYGVPHRIVRLGLPCSPCYAYSRHGIRCTNAVHLRCLKDLAPEQVAAAADDLLGEVGVASGVPRA
jgi:lipopolysaccharide heptosyltransferase II